MEDFNPVMVAKLGRKLMCNPPYLWVQAIAAKYCKGRNFLKAPLGHNPSWFWQSLIKTKAIIGAAGFCWGVKDGVRLNIWCDPWVPDLPGFVPKLKTGTLVDRHINYVRDLIDEDTHEWKENVIRDLFDDSSSEAILSIPLPPARLVDTPLWIHSPSGSYPVKDAYLYCQKQKHHGTGDLTAAEWRKIWKLKVEHRLKLLLWKLAAEALPLHGRIHQEIFDHELPLASCPLCYLSVETREHLFLGCSLSRILWRQGPWPFLAEQFLSQPFHFWLKTILNESHLPLILRQHWRPFMLSVVIILDTIWMVRNQRTHGGKETNVEASIREVHSQYAAHLEAWHCDPLRQVCSWQPPHAVALKVNFDVAVKHSILVATAICREDKGGILKMRFCHRRGTNPLKGEALAARLAFSLADAFPGKVIYVEGDSQILINQVLATHLSPDWAIEGEVVTIQITAGRRPHSRHSRRLSRPSKRMLQIELMNTPNDGPNIIPLSLMNDSVTRKPNNIHKDSPIPNKMIGLIFQKPKEGNRI
ncbi:hypothetical protein CJ030_MR7G017447 [Morella rubra]|uniref:Reverse transcriptase zinc-binding domain-containing protein n=1 Tax=Morella rubra TaxID=262757 RepID=A0A6A1V868_9ROSI|nr:hypothetical protein CJ030_MR7G017447 [Morella rubra]